MLDRANSPADLRHLSYEGLERLAADIGEVITTTLVNRGYLASNRGTVEATTALHRVFNTTGDRMVGSGGHRVYARKLLTVRKGRFTEWRG